MRDFDGGELRWRVREQKGKRDFLRLQWRRRKTRERWVLAHVSEVEISGKEELKENRGCDGGGLEEQERKERRRR